MLPPKVVYLLQFFDLSGFNTKATCLSKQRKYIYFVYVMHISLVLYLTLFFCYLVIHYYPVIQVGILEAISENFQYSFGLATYWLIIFDLFHHRHTNHHFLSNFQKIYSRFPSSSSSKCTFQQYIVKLVEYLSVTLLIMIIKLSLNSFMNTFVEISYTIVFKVCQIRIFYYIFCLEVVHFQLKSIESEIQKIQSGLKFLKKNITIQIDTLHHESSLLYFFEIYRFQWIRRHFDCVYAMVEHLNEIFGWSNVAAISYCFYLFLTDLNWFYIHYRDLSLTYCIGI